MSELLPTLERVLDRARPGEEVEAYGVDETETTVRAHEGEVESLSSSRKRGIGVRMLVDGCFGYAHTSDLSESALDDALAAARANAGAGTPDEANVLPAGVPAEPVEGLYHPGAVDVPTSAKVQTALDLEAAVRGAGAPVRGVEMALCGDGIAEAAIASTRGVRGTTRRSEAYVLVEALCEAEGTSTSAYGVRLGRHLDELDVEGAARDAVTRSARLLGGRQPTSGRIPVLLDPQVTADVLGVLSAALSAEAAQRGRSLFADRVGDHLAESHVTLVDDGRHPQGPASAPFDGEGVPTQRTMLLADGVLTGFLHDSRSAARAGATSTGNAVRAGHRGPPTVGPTNGYLEPGQDDPDTLFARAGEAFYCQQVMGLHSGANPVSGELSVGAAGLMVRDGAFAEPVREATIAGSIPDLLAGIVAVGNDLRFVPVAGGMGGQTLLVESMTLAGS